jgi:hypothetical protein
LAASPRCRCRGVNEMRELRGERGSIWERCVNRHETRPVPTVSFRAGEPSRMVLVPLLHLTSTSTDIPLSLLSSSRRGQCETLSSSAVCTRRLIQMPVFLAHSCMFSPDAKETRQRSTSYSRSGSVRHLVGDDVDTAVSRHTNLRREVTEVDTDDALALSARLLPSQQDRARP